MLRKTFAGIYLIICIGTMAACSIHFGHDKFTNFWIEYVIASIFLYTAYKSFELLYNPSTKEK